MNSSLVVRPARADDASRMACVNVQCWQETYRGLVPDRVLDDPGFPAARERFWTSALRDPRYGGIRVAVTERDGEMVGIAMSGPTSDAGVAWARQLYVLYVRATDHGTGAGQALLEAVIDPEEPVALWGADPNPRAQAFYRKHGFTADGTAQVVDGVHEIRMLRHGEHSRWSSTRRPGWTLPTGRCALPGSGSAADPPEVGGRRVLVSRSVPEGCSAPAG